MVITGKGCAEVHAWTLEQQKSVRQELQEAFD